MNWHLAHVNVGVAKFTYDDPRMAGFVDNLDQVNAIADEAPGFVWRYLETDDYPVGREVFGDDAVLFNMSMWASKAALMDYTYKSGHVDIMRKRAEWFVPQEGPILALWWQPAGTLPTPVEAKHRLDKLRDSGPGIDAFTFRHFFEAPSA